MPSIYTKESDIRCFVYNKAQSRRSLLKIYGIRIHFISTSFIRPVRTVRLAVTDPPLRHALPAPALEPVARRRLLRGPLQLAHDVGLVRAVHAVNLLRERIVVYYREMRYLHMLNGVGQMRLIAPCLDLGHYARANL